MRLLKRFVALFMVLLLSIENFAAVVSDNDGSAFITKAEFDSLKNNFQSQIDQYNTSIDAKIDGAIAEYLAGIKMETKKQVVCPVENLNDICWSPGFEILAKRKTWTSRSAKTKTSTAEIITPNYQNFENWCYMATNRGIKSAYFEMTNGGLAAFFFKLGFNTDNTYVKTSTNAPYNGSYNYTVPLLCLCVDENGAIDNDLTLFQLTTVGYNLFRFGLYGQSNWGIYAGNITVTPITPQHADAYFALQIKKSSSDYLNVEWNTNNTEAQATEYHLYTEAEPTTSNTTLESNALTYPLNSYWAPSAAQANADKARITNMMIGRASTYRLPVLWNMRNGGRSGEVGKQMQSHNGWYEGENTYFPDWSKWNKKSIATTLTLYGGLWGREDGSPQLQTVSTSRGGTTVNYNIPVHTFFDLNTLKSGVARYNGNGLDLCGGIPLIIDIDATSNLEIELRCKKYNIDVNASPISASDNTAKLKLKKSKDNNGTTTDYLSAEDSSGIVKMYDGTTVSNVSNIKLKIEDLNRGDSVWLNIDPIDSGTYIKIESLKLTQSTT